MASVQQTLLPIRSPGTEINIAEVNPQTDSLLFRLPAELRIQIYEYVFGTGMIHIILRSCKDTENPLFRITTDDHHDYQKLTYSTCRCPSSFEQRHALSKEPQSNIPVMYYNSNFKLPAITDATDLILTRWELQHAACYSGPQRDMVQEAYKSSRCDAYPPDLVHHPRGCKSCVSHRAELEKAYGPPTAKEGLKRFHAESALSVHGLLGSCRFIYREARELPFKLYAFDVNGEYLSHALTRWLEPWQATLIERLHLATVKIDLDQVVQLANEKRILLKSLEIDLIPDDRYFDYRYLDAARQFCQRIEHVKIVWGFDEGLWETPQGLFDRRASRRRMAESWEYIASSLTREALALRNPELTGPELERVY